MIRPSSSSPPTHLCHHLASFKWWVTNSESSDSSYNPACESNLFLTVSHSLWPPYPVARKTTWAGESSSNVRVAILPMMPGQIKSLDYWQRISPGKQTWETTSNFCNMFEEVQVFHQVKFIPPIEGDRWGGERYQISAHNCSLSICELGQGCSIKGSIPHVLWPHHISPRAFLDLSRTPLFLHWLLLSD